MNGKHPAFSDKLNRLSTVTVPGQSPTLYSYDEVGNLAGYTYPNGVTTALQYDPLNRLTLLASLGARGAVASYAYTLGAAGNRTGVTELSGRTVAYGYDNLYRLTSETIASDLSGMNGATGYVYDTVGNRQQMTSTLPAIAPGRWNYDANDRLTSDQNDADGNITSRAGVANAYDFENHLIQHGYMTFVYDGDGNRVAKTVGGVTTTYLVDTLNPTGYAQVLDELQSNTVARSYTWGLQLVSESQLVAATPPANPWQTSWYGFDGHGSVRYLTSSTGAVTDTYDYDAFGNLINSTGSTANNYLFAGEQFDPNLGLYYNRARYLDVQLGRFWGMDTYSGTSFDPLTLHKYLYAGDSPVNHRDPSGREFDLGSTLGAIADQAILIARSVPNLVGAAFGTGTIGLLWNRLGAAVEDIGAQTLVLLEDELPEIQVAEEETIANSTRVIDWVARSADGLRELFIEAKYGIPYANGPAMSRLVAQMQAASAAAETSGGRVVLFLIRAPGFAQYNNLMTQLGSVASDVEIVVGPEALYYFVRGYFGF